MASNDKVLSPASEAAKGVSTSGATSDAAKNTQQYLNTYNENREQKIRDMYAGSLKSAQAAQKTALDANVANARNAYQQNMNTLQNAYEQNLSDAQAAREKISPQYQQSMNALGAEYERQKRNLNMQAAANGLNTGAGSQLALGQSMAYQGTQGNLARSEREALGEADRGISDLERNYNNQTSQLGVQYENNLMDLKTNYQNQIAQAAADNDYRTAAALLDEYGAQYDRTMSQAEQLSQFGDFSMYASIYGNDAAQQMEKMWGLQNPDLAYNLGKITADEYFKMTGKYPRGYSSGGGGRYSYSGGGSGGSYGFYGGGSGGSGGSSSTSSSTGNAIGKTTPFGNYTDGDVVMASGKYANLSPASGGLNNLSRSSSSPISSGSSGGGTTYGNIGNNKITVGGGKR